MPEPPLEALGAASDDCPLLDQTHAHGSSSSKDRSSRSSSTPALVDGEVGGNTRSSKNLWTVLRVRVAVLSIATTLNL